ncbi:MAG: hypothetical protein OHK0036_18370 [Bacteroidia bacterium]
MKLFLIFLLAVIPLNDLTKIARANEQKAKAEEAYKNKDYETAMKSYHILLDSMGVNDPSITLNLAHCYFHKGDKDKASQYYQIASTTDDKEIRSVANQQLGVIQADKRQLESALSHFKQALKADPTNEDARKNYEIVKRLIDEQKKENKKEEEEKKDEKEEKKENKKEEQQKQEEQQKKEQEKQKQEEQQKKEQQQSEKSEQSKEKAKEGQNSEQKSQEAEEQEGKQGKQQEQQEEKEQQEAKTAEQKKQEQKKQQERMTQQRLQQINMSKEQAQMLLDAMKAQEVQYYQQLRRKTQKADNGKPDW